MEHESKAKDLFKQNAKLRKDLATEREKSNTATADSQELKDAVELALKKAARAAEEVSQLKKAHAKTVDVLRAEKSAALAEQQRAYDEVKGEAASFPRPVPSWYLGSALLSSVLPRAGCSAPWPSSLSSVLLRAGCSANPALSPLLSPTPALPPPLC